MILVPPVNRTFSHHSVTVFFMLARSKSINTLGHKGEEFFLPRNLQNYIMILQYSQGDNESAGFETWLPTSHQIFV